MAKVDTLRWDCATNFPTWLSNRNGTTSVSNGVASIGTSTSTGYANAPEAQRTYDFTGGTIFVKWHATPVGADSECGFGLLSGPGASNLIQIWCNASGQLQLRRRISNSDTVVALGIGMNDASLNNSVWIRLRESGGTIYADTSTPAQNGLTWTQRASVAKSTLNLTTVGLDNWAYGASGFTLTFSNLNIHPRDRAAASSFFI